MDRALAVVAPSKLIAIPTDESEGMRRLKLMGKYAGANGTYEIFSVDGGPLAATAAFALYVAKLPTGQLGLMKIAQAEKWNEQLVREVKILTTLHTIAHELDEDARAHSAREPNYGAFFPTVIESFIPDGVDRQVSFLGYHSSIKSYKQLVPLAIAVPNRMRIDLQSGSWIIAKGTKLLQFVHELGFTVGRIDETNILLETDKHGVFALDFTAANEDASQSDTRAEVRDLANLVWQAAGGNDRYDPPHDREVLSAEQYADFIAFLEDLKENDWTAGEAFEALYEHADEYWPKVPIDKGNPKLGMKRQFHPWKLLPR